MGSGFVSGRAWARKLPPGCFAASMLTLPACVLQREFHCCVRGPRHNKGPMSLTDLRTTRFQVSETVGPTYPFRLPISGSVRLIRSLRSADAEMSTAAPPISRLRSPFLCCRPIRLSPSAYASSVAYKPSGTRRPPSSYPRTRAELDQSTVVAISVGVVSVAVGIGIPIFYETQIDNAAKRENTQPCFPCSGSGAQRCRFCLGTGTVTAELGGGEKEVSNCINCEGVGSLTCTTCQGSGIQPRYLDRREFKDDD
ncbi:hypothetical protein SAY86_029637 [Trapa natans]|uniref:Protein SPA, chloroplastic n=1 Tax=Trapa natans TaxID=22666 RepID=A0AAN7RGA6_TRANT|nr:hypothetical protein SAY86_029637 [Trapa natans]